MDSRTISEKYTKIGMYLIDQVDDLNHLKDETIVFLSSTAKKKSKGELVLGECEKIAEKNKWAIPCNFTITLFEPNLEGLTEEQIAVVIFHELLHVGTDGEDRWVNPHDLKDFRIIIERYGANWEVPGNEIRDPLIDYAVKEGERV